MNRFSKILVVSLNVVVISGCAMWREYTEKEYKRLAEMPEVVHQHMDCLPEINKLDVDACVYLNLCLRHMRATVTESDYHRIGVGFENDVEAAIKEEGLSPAAAFAKVKELIIKEDAERPEDEQVWKTVEAWMAAKEELKALSEPKGKYDVSVHERLSEISKRLSDALEALEHEMRKLPPNKRNTNYYKSLQQKQERLEHNQECLGVVYSRLADCGACATVEMETLRREMVLKYYSK